MNRVADEALGRRPVGCIVTQNGLRNRRWFGWDRGNLADELIPLPGDGLDVARRYRVVSEQVAKLADDDVQVLIYLDMSLVAPQSSPEFVFADDSALPLYQEKQHLKREILNADRHIASRQHMAAD